MLHPKKAVVGDGDVVVVVVVVVESSSSSSSSSSSTEEEVFLPKPRLMMMNATATTAKWCSSSSRSSQGIRASYAGLNKMNDVYARSMGSAYSRAKTFAENVLEQTMTNTKGRKHVTTMMPIGVPRVPYKTPGENMWQWVDIWNCLYRERLIWIGQNIDDELGNQLVATMLFLDNLDSTKPMYLYINTEGGQVVPTMAIMDTMNHAKSKVGTVAFGSARAMGGLLLTNGEKGMRYAALPNTCVMLHHPSGVARGAPLRTSKMKAESCWQFARKSTRLSLKIAIKTLNWSEKRSIEINISPRNRRRIGGSSIKSCIARESKNADARKTKREREHDPLHTPHVHIYF